MGEPARTCSGPECFLCTTQIEDDPIYIHQRHGTSARPVKELKGFQWITLAPGETRTVTFPLPPDHLRYWSSATRDWVQDATTFDVFVGGSSEDTLQTTFEVV